MKTMSDVVFVTTFRCWLLSGGFPEDLGTSQGAEGIRCHQMWLAGKYP